MDSRTADSFTGSLDRLTSEEQVGRKSDDR